MDTTEDIPRFSYVSCAALTDVGRKRKNNEDNYGTFPDAGVFCVADGMGGARDGEVASRIVVEHLAGALRNWEKISPPIPIEDRLALLDKCLDAASLWINQYAASHDATGCGTTFVGVVFDPGKPGHAVAVHAGDSRLYRIHRHKITQITCDHSVANMTGVKDENELNPVFRNMILRAVGIKTSVELERTSFEVVSGDWILICSDGLTKMVDDKAIAKIVSAADGGKTAAHTLVAEANRCGGRDNITVVLLHIGELPPALPVHARLTEAEFLACMGAAAADAAATTETAFTMPTGDSSTEQNAVSEGSGGTHEGWLSEDEDSDNTPASVPVGEEGLGDTAGRKEEETAGGPGIVPAEPEDAAGKKEDAAAGGPGIVPAEPGDGSDADTKTTEDIPPPSAAGKDGTSQTTTSDSARTTEDMVPAVVGRRARALLPLFLAAAVLAGAAGVGIRHWQNAREMAKIEAAKAARKAEEERLAAIAAAEAARKAEEERLAAIKAAEDSFIRRANIIQTLLTNLLAQVSQSANPESLTNDLNADMDNFAYALNEAMGKGVTNAVNTERETMDKLAGQIRTAITERRREIDKEEAERKRLEALKKAEESFCDAVRKTQESFANLPDEIAASDNPDKYTNGIAKAKAALDDAWAKARQAGVTNPAPYTAKLASYTTLSNNVAKAIANRRKALDDEFAKHNAAYGGLKNARIDSRKSYQETLDAIDENLNFLPSHGPSSPWREKYDGLREKYKQLKASISARTAKVEVRNGGDVDLAVTLGNGKSVQIAKHGAHTFDGLDVWTKCKLSAEVAIPGGAGFQPTAADYRLDPAESTAATKGPDTTFAVSFAAGYKGDPTLVVKNGNAVAIKANGVEIGPKESHTFTGMPRTKIAIAYACDNADYEFISDADKPVGVAFGDAGAEKEIAAPMLVAKPKPATIADLKPSPVDLPASTNPKAEPTPSTEGDGDEKPDVADKNAMVAQEKTPVEKLDTYVIRAIADVGNIEKKYLDAMKSVVENENSVKRKKPGANDYNDAIQGVLNLMSDMQLIIKKGQENHEDVRDIYEIFKPALNIVYRRSDCPKYMKTAVENYPELKNLLQDKD